MSRQLRLRKGSVRECNYAIVSIGAAVLKELLGGGGPRRKHDKGHWKPNSYKALDETAGSCVAL